MTTQIPAGGYICDMYGSPFGDAFDVTLAQYAALIGDMSKFTESFAHPKQPHARYADDDEYAPPAKRARV